MESGHNGVRDRSNLRKWRFAERLSHHPCDRSFSGSSGDRAGSKSLRPKVFSLCLLVNRFLHQAKYTRCQGWSIECSFSWIGLR